MVGICVPVFNLHRNVYTLADIWILNRGKSLGGGVYGYWVFATRNERKEGLRKMEKATLQELAEEFLLEEKTDEKAESTLVHYRHVVELFLDSLKGKEVTKRDVMAFKSQLMDTYKPSTISNYITVVNKFIKYAEIVESSGKYELSDLKHHKSKMTLKNIKIQQKASLEEVLEPEEYKRMLRIAKKNGEIEMYLIMRIFAYTGIRVAELKCFKAEAVKESNYIEVSNKGKNRKIILRQDLRRELLKYCEEKGIEEGYIFRGRRIGTMMSDSTIWKKLKKIAGQCRGIKLSKVHAHSFRHLFAIKFLEEGGDIGELADILGHASVDTTRIYTRTTDYMKRKKLEKIKY